MRHRHLNHQGLTLAAIDDVIARGRRADWVQLRDRLRKNRKVAEKIRAVCRPRIHDPYAQRYHFWMNYVQEKRACVGAGALRGSASAADRPRCRARRRYGRRRLCQAPIVPRRRSRAEKPQIEILFPRGSAPQRENLVDRFCKDAKPRVHAGWLSTHRVKQTNNPIPTNVTTRHTRPRATSALN